MSDNFLSTQLYFCSFMYVYLVTEHLDLLEYRDIGYPQVCIHLEPSDCLRFSLDSSQNK